MLASLLCFFGLHQTGGAITELLFFLFNNMLSGLAEDVSYMIVVK